MTLQVQNKELIVYGRCPRIVRLYDEYFDWVAEPNQFLNDLKQQTVPADLFTFVQKGVVAAQPQYDFHHEWDELAVLQMTSYQDWFKKRIRHEERNRIKKAEKIGVVTRVVELDDDLLKGIKEIYDESPLRQGRPFRHYQKSLEYLRQITATFPDKCEFIGSYYEGNLIGFVKVMHDGDTSYLIQLISMMKQRDKSPANALIAKTVEHCAERGMKYLRYGNWCRRGLGEFKRNNGFEKVPVPRYFIPLNLVGKCALPLRLHRGLADLLPEKLLDAALDLRMKLASKLIELRSPTLPD
jgi:hypothetical protein